MGQQSASNANARDAIAIGRSRISVLLVSGVFILMLLILPGTLLTVFAGLLLAVLIRSCGAWTGRRLSLGPTWGVTIFLVAFLVLLIVGGAAAAPAISDQVDQLWRQIPDAVEKLRSRVESYAWGEQLVNRIQSGGIWSSASGGVVTSAVSSAFGSVGNAVLLLFIGLYGAFDPGTYRNGFVRLFAPSIRPRVEVVLSNCVETLRSWLAAQSIAMAVVGVLTGIGLWLVGIPLALGLGLIAGLLAFIPNVGPVLAASTGLLLAAPDGVNTVLVVLGIYVGVQMLESYVVTPAVQQEKVSLPPVLVIVSQLAFGALFGLIGLAMATPLTALILRLTSDLYVGDYLERRRVQDEPSERQATAARTA